jgi:DNA-directed RNA polymerase subunit M/transcription elongation factor TFIIS
MRKFPCHKCGSRIQVTRIRDKGEPPRFICLKCLRKEKKSERDDSRLIENRLMPDGEAFSTYDF